MKRYICAWFVVVALLLPVTALAQCLTQETVVLYLNGIDTTRGSAIASQTLIDKEVSKVPGVLTECVTYHYLYNTNEPLFGDLVQAGIQKADEQGVNVSEFWRWFFRLNPFVSGFSDLLIDFYTNTHTSIDLGLFVLGDQVDEHLVKIREYLQQGKKVILVSHSQGNLYANEEWSRLTEAEKSQVDIVAVATPSDYVAKNDNLHTTLTEDWIASLFPRALAANVSNDEECPDDWTCHGFKESYMRGINSQERIVNEIVSLLPTVPEQACRIQGLITDWDYRTIISGARVILQDNASGNGVLETASDATGHYCINIADGFYWLEAFTNNASLGGRSALLRTGLAEPVIIDFPIFYQE